MKITVYKTAPLPIIKRMGCSHHPEKADLTKRMNFCERVATKAE